MLEKLDELRLMSKFATQYSRCSILSFLLKQKSNFS